MTTKLDAIRWDGSNAAEIERFLDGSATVADDVLLLSYEHVVTVSNR